MMLPIPPPTREVEAVDFSVSLAPTGLFLLLAGLLLPPTEDCPPVGEGALPLGLLAFVARLPLPLVGTALPPVGLLFPPVELSFPGAGLGLLVGVPFPPLEIPPPVFPPLVLPGPGFTAEGFALVFEGTAFGDPTPSSVTVGKTI